MTLLTATRAAVTAAEVISAKIIAFAALVSAAATKVHTAALNAAVKLADKKVDKAYKIVEVLDVQAKVLDKLRQAALAAAHDRQKAFVALSEAARMELELIAS